jgi:hypothetical protein
MVRKYKKKPKKNKDLKSYGSAASRSKAREKTKQETYKINNRLNKFKQIENE